ncbi:hypothetical protein [Paeniglutamicibacter sulfureus]|uniref:Cell division septum initiation protein DivIVA n=1 Tax=Paeniglutamicibacter sulfureus TaxID=43666 RepID=A0ABU2BF68_9MICC|nr:hypothetical protein [Paeniglutamicibacter sulfureus]MDR7356398.1 cell division septum initiation protein DivIVA [Paeniglutamicibacter sulfureus]
MSLDQATALIVASTEAAQAKDKEIAETAAAEADEKAKTVASEAAAEADRIVAEAKADAAKIAKDAQEAAKATPTNKTATSSKWELERNTAHESAYDGRSHYFSRGVP